MPDQDYAKKIDEAKQAAIDALNAQLPNMESTSYDIILQIIDDTFDIKGGQIISDVDFVNKLNQLSANMLDLIQKAPEFKGPVSKFVKRMNTDVSGAIDRFQKEVNDITTPDFKNNKKVVIDEIIEQMLGNGLNAEFVQPIRDLIYQNVSSGLSLKQIKQQLKEYIASGKDKSGKLGRYLDQTAQQAADSYSGTINKKLLETFKYNALLMTGTLIDTSSPQCQFVIDELGGKLKRSDWPAVLAHTTDKQPMIAGTTFDNLPVNRFHWGCRHSFYPIILEDEKPVELEYKNLEVIRNDDNKEMSDDEINKYLKVVGIPDVKGKVLIFSTGIEVNVRLDGEEISMLRTIDLDDKIIDNKYFYIESNSQYKGQGSQIFKNQVDEAAKQGYKQIRTTAIRDIDANGYYTWARLGYRPTELSRTNVINPIIKKFNDIHTTDVKSLEELMATKEGQEYWKKNGKEFYGLFDLKEGSYSVNTLNNYIDGRRKK